MGSSAKTKNSTENTTINTSRNLNLQDTSGTTIGEAGGDVTINTTDGGAIKGIVDTTLSSNNLARDIVGGALHANADVTSDAFDLVDSTTRGAFSYFDRINSSALDFVRETTGNLYAQALTQVGGTVDALNSISKEQNKSTDQRIAELSQNAIKYVIATVAIIAVAALVYSRKRV